MASKLFGLAVAFGFAVFFIVLAVMSFRLERELSSEGVEATATYVSCTTRPGSLVYEFSVPSGGSEATFRGRTYGYCSHVGESVQIRYLRDRPSQSSTGSGDSWVRLAFGLIFLLAGLVTLHPRLELESSLVFGRLGCWIPMILVFLLIFMRVTGLKSVGGWSLVVGLAVSILMAAGVWHFIGTTIDGILKSD